MAELLGGPRWRFVALLAAVLLATRCGGDGDAAPVDRETFVSVWVDLRLASLGSPGENLEQATRERILERHGTTEDELLAFVEAHGRDVAYMETVWQDVEERINELFAPADTAG